MSDLHHIFNRQLVKARRSKAAASWTQYAFLKQEAVSRLVEIFNDLTRDFKMVLDIGCHQGEFATAVHGNPKIGTVIQCDLSPSMAMRATGLVCVADEEFVPFGEQCFDAIVSALSLHHVNDLPGTLVQLYRCLKQDGLLILILPGSQTLWELRTAMVAISAQQGFSLSPRVSPFLDAREASSLLTRAGFVMPVVESDSIAIDYDNPLKLFADLRGMGEGNVLRQAHGGLTTPHYFDALCRYYESEFAGPNAVQATCEFVTLTAWKTVL